MNISINLWSVLVSSVAAMVVGATWYGPLLFGKAFMKARGMDTWTPEKRAAMTKAMPISYGGQFVASLIMFYVLAGLIVWSGDAILGHVTVASGMGIAFWMWLGFVLPIKLGDILWGGKKEMFWLTLGNMLITLLVAGAIIGAMN
jgi:hypothetical protein